MAEEEEETDSYNEVMKSIVKQKFNDKKAMNKEEPEATVIAIAVPNTSPKDNDDISDVLYQLESPNKSRVHLSERDSKVICLIVSCLLVLTFISHVFAFSSIFRDESNLSMERSSFWWYFLYSGVVMVSILSLVIAVWGTGEQQKSFIFCSLSVMALMCISDFLLVTRFLLVTFPIACESTDL